MYLYPDTGTEIQEYTILGARARKECTSQAKRAKNVCAPTPQTIFFQQVPYTYDNMEKYIAMR